LPIPAAFTILCAIDPANKGTRMAAKKSQIEIFAVPFAEARKADGIGLTKGYKLLHSGEWQSFMDGGTRMVTVASINRRRERLLAAAGDTFKPAPFDGRADHPRRRRRATAAAATTPEHPTA
jgi:hypothetical protein